MQMSRYERNRNANAAVVAKVVLDRRALLPLSQGRSSEEVLACPARQHLKTSHPHPQPLQPLAHLSKNHAGLCSARGAVVLRRPDSHAIHHLSLHTQDGESLRPDTLRLQSSLRVLLHRIMLRTGLQHAQQMATLQCALSMTKHTQKRARSRPLGTPGAVTSGCM